MHKSNYLLSVLILLCTLGSTIVQAQTKTIFLVRHAEKAEAVEGNRDPELNEAGLIRSEKLAEMLSDADVDFIYSTDFKRTRGTGLPLAKASGKEIIIYNPREPGILDKILEETGNERILVIGHSNTVPMMVNQLIKEDRFSFLDESEYDKLFIVTISGDLSDCIVIKY